MPNAGKIMRGGDKRICGDMQQLILEQQGVDLARLTIKGELVRRKRYFAMRKLGL
jgi:hypothetical protein